MNIHGLKKKQKHINRSLGQHYSKRHRLNLTIDELELAKRENNEKLRHLKKIANNNKKKNIKGKR